MFMRFIAVAALLQSAVILGQNLVVNGDFSVADGLGGWTVTGSTFPWVARATNIDPNDDTSGSARNGAPPGDPSTLSQDITDAQPTACYSLSFFVFLQSNTDYDETNVALDVSFGSIQESVPVLTQAQGDFIPYSYIGRATSSKILTFTGINDPSFTFLDNVVIEAVDEVNCIGIASARARARSRRTRRRNAVQW